MGICSSQMMITKKTANFITWPTTTVKVIHHKYGTLQEFNQPIKARHVLCRNPNTFLCSSESMYVDSIVPHLSDEEELELEQLYFLLPISMCFRPLSLHDLCDLAIKASLALRYNTTNMELCPPTQSSSCSLPSRSNSFKFVAQARRYCQSPMRLNVSRSTRSTAPSAAPSGHMIKLKGF